MSAHAYFQKALAALQQTAETQLEPVRIAAGMLVETLSSGRAIYSFGASHSFMLTEEMVYRTGGLMLINPIYPHGMNSLVRPMTLTSRLERVPGLGAELLHSVPAAVGDALILTSTSGRNAVTIDMAMAARDRGMKRIGIVSRAYMESVESRHASGKKLADFCDVVLDNGAPLGDACVEIPGLEQKTGPISTVTGCALVNALIAEVLARLVDQGISPPVFQSANLDGGDAYNARRLAENRDRIHYLD
ncbi:MAG: SIS domain-containing protein [Kiritimatiellia bacterium]|nr:SIS domain-containing protein [Kiritimatiellia bacterium]